MNQELEKKVLPEKKKKKKNPWIRVTFLTGLPSDLVSLFLSKKMLLC